MINDAVELLFGDILGWPFETMHPDAGVPTVSFNVRFKRPCRHGNQLDLCVTLTHVGRSSLSLNAGHKDATDVFQGKTGAPMPPGGT